MSGNFVPASGGSGLGTSSKPWSGLHVGELHADSVIVRQAPWYGLEVDYGNGVAASNAERLGDAEGMAAEDFDGLGPWNRRRCVLADDGHVVACWDQEGYIEDGTAGQVMVEQPAFWYKVDATGLDGSRLRRARYRVSPTPRPGWSLHPAFIDKDGKANSRVYVGAFEASLSVDGKRFDSAAWKSPHTGGHSNGGMVGVGQARGPGWHMLPYALRAAELLLMMVERGGLDLQSLLGQGNAGTGAVRKTGDTAYFPGTNNLGVGSYGGPASVCWRGEENPWGNVWESAHGLWVSGGKYWALSRATGGSGLELCFDPPSAGGWTSAFGYDPQADWAFAPTETSGSSAGPVCDYAFLADHNFLMLGGSSELKAGGAAASGPFAVIPYGGNVPALAGFSQRGTRIAFYPSEVGQ